MSELTPILAEIEAIHATKSEGYGREGEPFYNVIEGAKFAGIQPWVAALIRANDKMGRLSLAAQGTPASDESIEDNLIDTANYLCIALALRRREVGHVSLEAARTLLAPDYPQRRGFVALKDIRQSDVPCPGDHDLFPVFDSDFGRVRLHCARCFFAREMIPLRNPAPDTADPLHTEPGDWKALEHGSPE